MPDKVFDSLSSIKAHSLGEQPMRSEHGEPLYSSNPKPPRNESGPVFSGPIAPGPNEGKRLRSGPGWIESLRNCTPVQHSGSNKSDTANIGRGKPITY